ncbi:MAG TPA: hypothetical protein PKA39_13845 [Ignavibacteria bacterium]|nr:hypothetical protein [Ignavibacteria bacterium]
MILIEVSSSSQVNVNSYAWKIFHFLNGRINSSTAAGGIEVLKPAQALIYKIKNTFRMHIILKIHKTSSEIIAASEDMMFELKGFSESLKMRSTERINIDVDPLSFY